MKESNFQDFRNDGTQGFLEENKKPDLKKYFSGKDGSDPKERINGNQLTGILKFLEPKDALNFLIANWFIKKSLYGENATENTKEFVFETIYLPPIKNGIEKIISLEKYANMLFGEIIEPFVSDFYEQNFSDLHYRLFHGPYDGLFSKDKRPALVLCYLAYEPDKTMCNIKEMLRYIVFIKLVECIHSNKPNGLIKSIYDNIVKDLNDKAQAQVKLFGLCKNIIINYLNSDPVIKDIKNFFYNPPVCKLMLPLNKFIPNVLLFLNLKFSKELKINDKKDRIISMLLKFIISRSVHVEAPIILLKGYMLSFRPFIIPPYYHPFYNDYKKIFFSVSVSYFARYLNETGDLEQLLFNLKAMSLLHLLRAQSGGREYFDEYRKYLKTERAKAYFDKMLITRNPFETRCKKAKTFIKYYGWNKWVACAKDVFNSVYDGCTRTKDFLKTNFYACCKKRRPRLDLNLSIGLNKINEKEIIPLLDNNNQENDHEYISIKID